LLLIDLFQKLHISTTWNLLENIHRERETSLESDEKDNPINYECIEKFLHTGKMEDLNYNFHLCTNMILQISRTYAKYLQALEDPSHFTPPDAKVFMVMVRKDMSTEAEPVPPKEPLPNQLEHINEENEGGSRNEEDHENETVKEDNTTGNAFTDHIFPSSSSSYDPQQHNNCSEEAISLATDMGNNDDNALDVEPCYESCNTNMVQKSFGDEDEASTLEEDDCNEELMQLEDMQLVDMWYQVDYCSQMVKSFK